MIGRTVGHPCAAPAAARDPGRCRTAIATLAVTAALVFAASAQASTFTLVGDPTAFNGATWTLRDTLDGVIYDLTGILFEPSGPGPYPTVIVSHGAGGNAYGYSRTIARTMRGWGLVAIGANYTHAGEVPIGSPGTAADRGASDANLLRARRVLSLLATRPRADTTRVAAHGHSMGGFVTAALVGTTPGRFMVASHTAAGVDDSKLAYTKAAQAAGIAVPYQTHHGDLDSTVDLSADERLDSLLTARAITHGLIVYPGYTHSAIAFDATMLQRVQDWYTEHGLLAAGTASVDPPAIAGSAIPRIETARRDRDRIVLDITWGANGAARVELFDVLGRRVCTPFAGIVSAGRQEMSFPCTSSKSDVVFARARQGMGSATRRIVLTTR